MELSVWAVQAVRERRQPAMSGREGLKSLDLVFQAAEIAKELPC